MSHSYKKLNFNAGIPKKSKMIQMNLNMWPVGGLTIQKETMLSNFKNKQFVYPKWDIHKDKEYLGTKHTL